MSPKLELTAVLLGNSPHCAQILCGLKLLQDASPEKNKFIIEDRRQDLRYNPFQNIRNLSFLLVKYRDKRIIFDMNDGCQCLEQIRFFLKESDFYFKRSFSSEKNKLFLSEYFSNDSNLAKITKMYPLGFNYFVTFPNNPMNRSLPIQVVRWFQGLRRNDAYFVPTVFENDKKLEVETNPKILFYTRLWEVSPSSSIEWNVQCRKINATRCNIIRAIKTKYGKQFIGGLQKSKYALEVLQI